MKIPGFASIARAAASASSFILGPDGTIRHGAHIITPDSPVWAAAVGGGTFRFECFDSRGRRRWVDDAKNMVTLAGLDYINNAAIAAQAQKTTWYCGLIDLAGYTQLQAGDTMNSHGGWAENIAYTPFTRPVWSPGTSSGQVLTNATAMTFSMTPPVGSPATIRGAFLCTDATSNASTVLLLCTALFSGGNQQVNNGDTLKGTYNFTMASG